MTSHSQLAPLPTNLPFDLISETLGRGAYAFVRKGRDPMSGAVCAVKFIHKQYSEKYGNISARQLLMEVSIHKHVGAHKNVISFFASDENETWRWIAMEFADGGDLFDKIEADVGVQPDIAHLYFHQLLAGTEFMHSKGVAHRDIKPENILLDANGNLKLADFGFATLFQHKGVVKTSKQLVGSPPYVAPEVSQNTGYIGNQVDIWSIGVVLFVLLTGNTPWDEPTARSAEFGEYKHTNGHATYEPWNLIPEDVLGLIRGMMTIDPKKRYTIKDVKNHEWYTQDNPLMNSAGGCRDGLALATRLVEGLKVDFSQMEGGRVATTQVAATPSDNGDAATQPREVDEDVEMRDSGGYGYGEESSTPPTQPDRIPNTQQQQQQKQQQQPQDMDNLSLDWNTENTEFSCSQQPSQYLRAKAAQAQARSPVKQRPQQYASLDEEQYAYDTPQILATISEDPVQSQFSAQPGVPLTLTQAARRFNDICPAGRMTRFYTIWDYSRFLPLLLSSLRKSGVAIDEKCYRRDVRELERQGQTEYVKVKTRDGRKCLMVGSVGVERVTPYSGGGLYAVNFEKVKGDPVEWRRLFKKVSVLCQEAVFRGRGFG